jgi:probable DNA metabolism protein
VADTLWERKEGAEASPLEGPAARGPSGLRTDVVILAEREPGSFLRAACLAWARRAELAFADEPPGGRLFPQSRIAEAEVTDEEFQAQAGPKPLAFYRRCRRSAALERRLFFGLRHGGADTAQVARAALADIARFGFPYVLNKASDAGRSLASRARQVMVELHRLKGLIRFVPAQAGGEEISVGRAETPHQVGDLLALYFHERFGRYRIVLLVGRQAYVCAEAGEVLTDDAEPYREALARDDFERFWLAYYGSQGIPRRTNLRLRQQRLPKKYWSWVREAAQFASDGP